jgi:hypothetical protein
MRMLLSGLVLIAMGCLGAPAAHAEILIKYMAFLKGECLTAKVNQTDFTVQCKKGMTTHTAYQNGGVGFGFASEVPVSFMGNRDAHPSPTSYTLDIDVVTTIVDSTPTSRPASGTCTMAGDINTQATITCDVQAGEDHYVVVFENRDRAEIIYGRGFEPDDLDANARYAIRGFDRLYRQGGLAGLETYLQRCYADARALNRITTVLYCAALDFAGEWTGRLAETAASQPSRPYFAEAATKARALGALLALKPPQPADRTERLVDTWRQVTVARLRKGTA